MSSSQTRVQNLAHREEREDSHNFNQNQEELNDVSEKDPANLSNGAEEILNQDLETIKSDVKPKITKNILNESDASDRNEILSATPYEVSEPSTTSKA